MDTGSLCRRPAGLEEPAPALLIEVHARGLEGSLQHRDCIMRVTVATHEDIHGREVAFRPRVDGDMALCQDDYAGDATIRCEMVEVAVEYRRTRLNRRGPERRVDVVGIG